MEGIEGPNSFLIGEPQTRGYIRGAGSLLLFLFVDGGGFWDGRRDRRRGGCPRSWRVVFGPLLSGGPIYQFRGYFFPLTALGTKVAHPVGHLLIFRHYLVGAILKNQALIGRLRHAGKGGGQTRQQEHEKQEDARGRHGRVNTLDETAWMTLA